MLVAPLHHAKQHGPTKGCVLPAGSGERPSEGPLAGSAQRTGHDSVACMPGGTASPNALLAAAQTAQQQEGSAEDGSKGARLPGAAGDAETGIVDSQAAVQTAGGSLRLENSRRSAEVRADRTTCSVLVGWRVAH